MDFVSNYNQNTDPNIGLVLGYRRGEDGVLRQVYPVK